MFLRLISAFLLIIPFTITSSSNIQHQVINHHIKWITNQTAYPVKLSLPINDANLNDTTNWDWIKLSKNKLVTQLPGLFENYLVTESESLSNLYILNYDNKTHSDLSTYEPTIVNHVAKDNVKIIDSTDKNGEKNLFTLAYMNSHSIKVNRINDTLKVKCIADFYLAKFQDKDETLSENLIKSLMTQMEKNAIFKIAIKSTTNRNKKNQQQIEAEFKSNQNSFGSKEKLIDQSKLNTFTEQPPSSQKSVDSNVRNFFNPIFKANPRPQQQQQQQQQQTPQLNSYYQNHQAAFEYANYFRNRNHNLNSPNVMTMHFFDYVDYAPFTAADYSIPYSPSSTFYGKPHINDHIWNVMPMIRKKRQSQNNEYDFEEEHDEFESENLFKVRLSIGPLNIRKPLNADEEEISCTLDLINSENKEILDFSSTIQKTLDKKASQVRQEHPTQLPHPPQMPVDLPINENSSVEIDEDSSTFVPIKDSIKFNEEVPVIKSQQNLKTIADDLVIHKHTTPLMFLIDNSKQKNARSSALDEIRSKGFVHSERWGSASNSINCNGVIILFLSIFLSMFLFK